MTKSYLTLAAAVAVAGASPAFANAAAPAAPKPAAANQGVTRAAVIQGRDAAFKKIDSNNDGNITAAELAAADAAVTRARMQAEFNKLDTNHDGQLSSAEFLSASPAPSALTGNMSKTIAAFDKNKDGKLTADEFRAPQLAVFDKLDSNHDGTVSAAERQAAQAQRKQ